MSVSIAPRPGRNEPCHCGSGRKYKQCCLGKDEADAAAARATAAAAATAAVAEGAAETAAPAPSRAPKHQTHQPWRPTNARGFAPRSSAPRKVGGS